MTTPRKKPAPPKKKTAAEPKTPAASSVIETDGGGRRLYSITALARHFKLDRATVVTRLENAGLKPVKSQGREKLFDIDDARELLSQSEMNEAKLDKLRAEAELKRMEVKKREGELAPVAEFTEVVQQIFGRLYKRVCIQLSTRIAMRAHEADSSADVAELLKHELAKEFNNLRNDFEGYIGRS